MIKSNNLLVIDKTDIQKQPVGKEKNVTDWSPTDLRFKSHSLYLTSDMVVGNDESGNTIVLKNRWGNSGVVVSHEDYNKFIKLKNENNKSNSSSTKKRFVERFPIFNFWPFN